MGREMVQLSMRFEFLWRWILLHWALMLMLNPYALITIEFRILQGEPTEVGYTFWQALGLVCENKQLDRAILKISIELFKGLDRDIRVLKHH